MDITNRAQTKLSTNTASFNGTFSWQKVTCIGNDPVVQLVIIKGNTNPVTFVLTGCAQDIIWSIASN